MKATLVLRIIGYMDVYLLGAGFSKAIHDEMPLISDLGKVVVQELQLERTTLDSFDGNVEMWLSYIAEEQPWLSDAENLENQALFMRASEVISAFIQMRDPSQNRALEPLVASKYATVLRLVHKWCINRASVISFNYDLIFESLLGYFVKHLDKRYLYGLPLVKRSDSAGMFAPPASDENRPSLYKLHGSTNWSYGGVRDPHSPIVLRDFDTYGNTYDDLKPVIIPPTSSKSTFYNNAGLRAQWRNAGQELEKAQRLTIIGYSMPESDLQVRSMLATSLKSDAEIIIVDPAETVAERIGKYFPHQRTHFQSLDEYIEDRCDELFFWFSTAGIEVEHFGRDGCYRSRRSSEPPLSFFIENAEKTLEPFKQAWPSATASPRRDTEGLTRVFVSQDGLKAKEDPWETPSREDILDLRAIYPAIYTDLSDYQCRRMTRVFGGAWAEGWSPKVDELVEFSEYLTGKRSREDLFERFGPTRGVYPPRNRLLTEVEDDSNMAQHLSHQSARNSK